jgi:hypothetical protein
MSQEISRKVDEIAVCCLFDWAPTAWVSEPLVSRASSSHGVDDQIGTDLFARYCTHPGNVRYTWDGRCAGEQSANLDPPADGYIRSGLRHCSYRPFHDRPSACNATHGVIAGASCPVGNGWGKRLTIEIVDPNATGAKQAVGEPRQFKVADHPKS